ncbi:MAG: 3'(2'),5'-bisphosphate nucleotidase CysQ [Pseudomonadota bacterium]
MNAETEQKQLQSWLAGAGLIAFQAGQAILEIYERGAERLTVETKADDSPLTEADRRAHHVITGALRGLTPAIPVLSEESEEVSYAERRQWQTYWLVDPLDGTREFINRNGEFTVNIALIVDGEPVLGVVHVPVSGTTYTGLVGEGAWCYREGREAQPIGVRSLSGQRSLNVVGSRRHGAEALEAMLATLRQHFDEVNLVSMGSSLKICLLAEGEADLYPRLGPTSEWDTAAAHAVLRAAGGDIVTADFEPLRYNGKDSLLNPYFLALGDPDFPWQPLQLLENDQSAPLE